MRYPGNTDLSADIQDRILTTYDQTLDLAEQGNSREALVGCDFILRMDPRFEPARSLQGRLNGAEGAISVDDLRLVDEPELPALDLEAPADDLFQLDLDATEPMATTGLEAALSELLEKRDLKRLLQLAGENVTEVTGNPRLKELVETANSRLEAQPYVEGFLQTAQENLDRGEVEEAQQLIERARSLDPTHPGIVRLESPEAQTDLAFQAPRGDDGAAGLFDTRSEAPAGPSPAGPGVGAPPPKLTGDERIDELLMEGQGAFEKADYQTAIDAWSRIFLIDIDNDEAAQRIELARKLKEEGERRVEEVFHDALAAYDGGRRDEAETGFREVVRLQPSHLVAQEYLEKIAAERSGAVPQPLPTSTVSEGAGGSEADALFDDEALEDSVLGEPVFVPPPPGSQGSAQTTDVTHAPGSVVAPGRAGSTRSHRQGILVGLGVLALVMVAGWFFLDRWDTFFPNSEPEAAVEAPELDPIARATALYEGGRDQQAIGLLKGVSEEHPRYDDVQQLISLWEAEALAAADAETDGPGMSEDELAQFDQAVEAGRVAYDSGDYLLADESFRTADRLEPLTGRLAEMHLDTKERLQPLLKQIDLFNQREWERALPGLWELRDEYPDNRDVTRLIVSSYHNLAVRDLQRGDARAAVTRLQEAQELARDDPDLDRHLLFAQAYADEDKDLLYRIYVKYLPFR